MIKIALINHICKIVIVVRIPHLDAHRVVLDRRHEEGAIDQWVVLEDEQLLVAQNAGNLIDVVHGEAFQQIVSVNCNNS